MLTVPAQVRIYLHREPVDFRKAHDGLAAIVRSALGRDPLDGSVFVFLNRARDRVKLLQWDGNGLWLHYKRLEQGTFRGASPGQGGNAEIARADLAMLLEGIELKKGRIHRRFADSVEVQKRTGDADGDRTTPSRARRGARRELPAARGERPAPPQRGGLPASGVRPVEREAPRVRA